MLACAEEEEQKESCNYCHVAVVVTGSLLLFLSLMKLGCTQDLRQP